MKSEMSLARSFAILLVLAAGLAAVVLPSAWASPDDPWDGKPVDPDYQYATPQAYEDFADLKFGMRLH